MLQLPISNLEGLLFFISSSIQNELDAALQYRLTGSLPLVVSDILLIGLRNHPLLYAQLGVI
jgi:hypothetical protein